MHDEPLDVREVVLQEAPDGARVGSREQGFFGDRLALCIGVDEDEAQKRPTV